MYKGMPIQNLRFCMGIPLYIAPCFSKISALFSLSSPGKIVISATSPACNIL